MALGIKKAALTKVTCSPLPIRWHISIPRKRNLASAFWDDSKL